VENRSEQTRNHSALRKPRLHATAELNELYVLTSLSVERLREFEREMGRRKNHSISVSIISRRGEIRTTKKRKDILEFIRRATNRGLYCNALVSAVATVEDFIANNLRMVLHAYPAKIGKDRRLSVEELQSSGSLSIALNTLVSKEILSMLYKSPRDYMRYFMETLSIELKAADIDMYVEIKAARDLIVHNGGLVNLIYLEKAGRKSRAKEGQLVPVDKDYFDASIRVMKELVHSTFQQMLKVHGDSKNIADASKLLANIGLSQ
jgi:hypothetical protein